MKSDLDDLMKNNAIDAIIVTGAGDHNPAMVYLTGGAHLTNADLIKVQEKNGILFHGAMERDEAAKTGLTTVSFSNYPFTDLLKESGGSRVKAHAIRYQKMLQEAGIHHGRVALYGKAELGYGYEVFSALNQIQPELLFVSGVENDLLMRAMATKDDHEIQRIRRMGQVTIDVVAETADFLANHRVRNNQLIRKDGELLTIGDVKKKINLWLAERGAENPEGTIFSIGHDAGIPHSSGKSEEPLALGQTIIFDIFPCEIGGGYFYDFTRTWCLGYAPDDVQVLFEQVKSVFERIITSLKVNTPFNIYQQKTCELFESFGHPTLRANPKTETGYVHSIGHGVGLRVHDLPASGSTSTQEDILLPGSVITIEPGLYYPDKNMGVRIEDTLQVKSDSTFEILADYPIDLVLPIKS